MVQKIQLTTMAMVAQSAVDRAGKQRVLSCTPSEDKPGGVRVAGGDKLANIQNVIRAVNCTHVIKAPSPPFYGSRKRFATAFLRIWTVSLSKHCDCVHLSGYWYLESTPVTGSVSAFTHSLPN